MRILLGFICVLCSLCLNSHFEHILLKIKLLFIMTIFDLPYELQCIILLISQLLLIFFKVKHIQLIANKSSPIYKSIIVSFIIQVMWLIASAVGIQSMIQGTYFLTACYVTGGCIGCIIPLLKEDRKLF